MSGEHLLDPRRKGRITASVVGAILRLDKGHSRKWAWRVITEREPFTDGPDIQRGVEHEPDALMQFQIDHGALIQQVGFVPHPTLEWLGASPDGVIFEYRQKVTLEAKCPRTLHSEVPAVYHAQMQTQMECCDAAYGYFLSWTYNGFCYIKVERDAEWWKTAKPELEEFYELYVKPDVEPPRSARKPK